MNRQINTNFFKKNKFLVTGGGGFLGTYVVRKLKEKGVKDVFVPRSKDFDLRKISVAQKIVKNMDVVIHLAAQVGGIGYIDDYPGEIFYNNLIMGTQLMEMARKANVKKFISIGTACEYPKLIPRPFKEKNIWDGYPDEITAPYGMAKKMLLVQGLAYRKQYGFNSIHLIPVNLYGPEDNFDRISAHVIPALIKKIVLAKKNKSDFVEVWGKGKATREFLYIEDAAEAIVIATEKYDGASPMNIGTGKETSIKEVTEIIIKLTGYKGEIKWNKSKPDGQPKRQLDINLSKSIGFTAKTDLKKGLKKTIDWYLSQSNL